MTSIPVSVWRFISSKTDCFLVVFSFFLFYSSTISAEAETEAVHIFNLINERLGYMEQVALYKHQFHIPVEDLAREKVILEKSLLSATEQGLDSDSVSGFFQSQMDAAKAIQHRYRADWLATPPKTTEPIDLKKEIRPRLISLSKEIVASISKYLKQGKNFSSSHQTTFIDALKVHNLSMPDKENIFRGLLKVKSYKNLPNR